MMVQQMTYLVLNKNVMNVTDALLFQFDRWNWAIPGSEIDRFTNTPVHTEEEGAWGLGHTLQLMSHFRSMTSPPQYTITKLAAPGRRRRLRRGQPRSAIDAARAGLVGRCRCLSRRG